MRSRKTLSRFALLGVMALVAVMLMAVPGNATFAKKYDLSVTPSSIPAGGSLTFTAKYTNKSLYKIGTTELSVPSGFQVSAVGTPTKGVLVSGQTDATVRIKDLNLALGSSFTVAVTATAPCGVGSGSWSAVTETGNNFSGSPFTYNNAASARATTVTGSCSLEFDPQPTGTAIGEAINAPDGVSVQALNGADEPVAGVTISMTKATGPGNLTGNADVATTGTPPKATFTGLTLDAAGTYSLRASAEGYGTTLSSEFVVAGEVLQCGDTYPDGSIVNEPGPDAASNVDLSREETGACEPITVTVVIRATEVEIQKELLAGSAFTMTIEWTEEDFQYPLPPTEIAYAGQSETHPMQACGPDVGGFPTIPEGEFWCVTSLEVDELPSGKIQVTEGYFGAGDPRVTRG